jgi:hypothetical protein
MDHREIQALADRLEARANSVFAEHARYQKADLRRAAELLREYGQTKVTPETEQPFARIPAV